MKTKRKHNYCSLFKLKLILIVFIIGTWLVTFFPIVWLAPPLFPLTPFVYVGLSLAWIPIAYLFGKHDKLDVLTRLLIVTCLVSSLWMALWFHDKFLDIDNCNRSILCELPQPDYEVCGKELWIGQSDFIYIAHHSPWYTGVYDLCGRKYEILSD